MAIVLDGSAGITTPDLTDSSLTSGRVVYAGTSGNLTGSSALTYDGTNLKLLTATTAAVQFGATSNGTVYHQIKYNDSDGSLLIGGASASAYPVIFNIGNTEAMRLNASGNLGIGTTLPTQKLTVGGMLTTYTDGIVLANSTNWGYGSSVTFRTILTNGGSLGDAARITQGYDSSNNFHLAFSTTGSGTLTERVRISSAGYVTTPYQPAFQTSGASLNGVIYTGGSVTLNTGSHFNTSTGTFTAPVTGNYLFSFALTLGDSNAQFIDIYANGVLYEGHMLQYTASFTTGSQTLIIPMYAGDTVRAQVRDASYSIYNARFCGYLLG
jgi:hypothetical protein